MFHILEVTDGKGSFREVDGTAVDIMGVPAFVRNNTASGYFDCWTVTDVLTGTRLSNVCGTKNGAIRNAKGRMQQKDVETWKEDQAWLIDTYGRSPSVPEPENEIIVEPQEPGEIETCRWETHCGHH